MNSGFSPRTGCGAFCAKQTPSFPSQSARGVRVCSALLELYSKDVLVRCDSSANQRAEIRLRKQTANFGNERTPYPQRACSYVVLQNVASRNTYGADLGRPIEGARSAHQRHAGMSPAEKRRRHWGGCRLMVSQLSGRDATQNGQE